jgi:hypothetical protein
MRLLNRTIVAILGTGSPYVRRSATGTSFALVATVHEGMAVRFAASAWSDQMLAGMASELIVGIGWNRIDQAANRQVVVRCHVPEGNAGAATADIDFGDGFVPLPIEGEEAP